MITFPTVRITIIQLAILLVLAVVVLLIEGWVLAYSVLLGGFISLVPGAYFAHKVFRDSGARAIDKVVRNIYIGEAVKLVLMGTGFALAFIFISPLSAPALFGGFLVIHIAGMALAVRLQSTS